MGTIEERDICEWLSDVSVFKMKKCTLEVFSSKSPYQ